MGSLRAAGLPTGGCAREEVCVVAELDVVLRLEPVREALGELERRDAPRRLLERDTALWSDDPTVRARIADRLGWLDAVEGREDWRQALAGLARDAAADGLGHVVLAGMGGSSLAPEVFSLLYRGHTRGATLTVLDSTHPDVVRAALDDGDLDHTLVIVASKSGSTEETACFASRASSLVPSPDRLFAITDPGSALAKQAEMEGWRGALHNPSDIGGRFSALSLFGMAPAALIGVDVDAVWATAAALRDLCGPPTPIEDDPGAQLAAYIAGMARHGRDKLTLLAPPPLSPLGDWIEQLVAESTGKQGVGVVPIVGEPVGRPDAYGDDRAFVAYRFGDEEAAGAAELADAGHPVLVLHMPSRDHLGAEFLRWELATALAGALLGVNPFDEPNVTEAKEQTKAILAEVVGGGSLPVPEHGVVPELLRDLRPGDYLAIQAYLAPDVHTVNAFTRVRAALRDRGLSSTFGWGPRFLHSTGQLHKGGGDNVAVLQVVDQRLWDDPAPLPVPDRPYDFGTLVRAQAVGDLRALRAHGRRVAQVGVDGADAVERLVEAALHALAR